jgi:hypothetical protein
MHVALAPEHSSMQLGVLSMSKIVFATEASVHQQMHRQMLRQ